MRCTYRRTNEDVMSGLGIIRKVLAIIRQRKLRYVGHALRNANTDLISSVFQGKMEVRGNEADRRHHSLTISPQHQWSQDS